FEVIGYYYDYFDEDNNSNGLDVESTSDWYTDDDIKERQKAFISKAVEELGHHDNVIWEIINEGQVSPPPPNGNGSAWLNEMRREISSAQNDSGHRPHLIQPFDLPDHRDLSGHHTPGNDTDPDDYVAEYQAVHGGLVQDYADNDQPLIDDNDCCATPGTPEQLRKKAWLSLVSGAHPSMLVYNVTGGTAPVQLGIGNPNHPTQQGMRWVGYTKTFVEDLEIDLVGMAPADGLLSGTSGGPAWCLARADEEYIVYFFDGGSTSIPSLAGRNYDAYWFDPVNGTFSPGPTMGTAFTTPTSGDWALHILPGTYSRPLPPTNVEATNDLTDRVRVTWDLVSNAEWYWIYRKTVLFRPGPPTGPPLAMTTELSFDDFGGHPCFAREYWIKAVNQFGISDFGQGAAGQFNVTCHWDQLSPTADAWVQQDEPDTNHGFGQELRIRAADTGMGRYSFLRFEVPDFTALSFAELNLRVQETSIPSVDFYLVTGMSWGEGTVTWNNWDDGDVTYEYLGSTGPREPGWGAFIDLSSVITASGEITIGITSSHDLDGLDLGSRESSDPPDLDLIYIE
ncbi:MAG: DNRLRE domain-containing protein, partial [bacterium]|nr:DNRLRE domain-containing protein [bacterium]